MAIKSKVSTLRLLLLYVLERIVRIPAFFFMAIHSYFINRIMRKIMLDEGVIESEDDWPKAGRSKK